MPYAVIEATGERMKLAILSSFLTRSGVQSNEKLSERKFLNEAAVENIGPGARLILARRARRDAFTASKLCGPLIQQTKPPDGLEIAQSFGSISEINRRPRCIRCSNSSRMLRSG